MDMVNDGVEDLRLKYVTLIYTKYVSLNPSSTQWVVYKQRGFYAFGSILSLPLPGWERQGSMKRTNRQLREREGLVVADSKSMCAHSVWLPTVCGCVHRGRT